MGRLKELMQATGKTGAALAEHAGITKQTFSGYLQKGRTPVCSVIADWVNELNINANWLLLGKGEMFRHCTPDESPTEDRCDPVVQRMETAVRLLKDVGASEEIIQEAILKALDTSHETHTDLPTMETESLDELKAGSMKL
ncbi:MAG: helix-turn-helix domain containing protein [Desulfovibrionales bacterium]|nr:helix-turn-helix domain containing protein [Desulfovibrionales bacterium]